MPAEDNLTDGDFTLAYKTRLIHQALHHLKTIDGRTAVVLQKNQLTNRPLRNPIKRDRVRVLTDSTHPDRLPCSPGPLVFLRQSDKRREAFDVRQWIVSPSSHFRSAALHHFLELRSSAPDLLSANTAQSLDCLADAVRSRTRAKWQAASLSLFDLLNQDFLCDLAALRQSVEMSFGTTFRDFFPRVLRPRIKGLAAVSPPLGSPVEERDRISDFIDVCIMDSESLEDAMMQYFKSCGHLPLNGQLSMSELVRRWKNQKQDRRNPSDQIWAWVNKTASPLARISRMPGIH